MIGKRIKLLRTENNLTQLEFAKILNIANSTLSQYEAGNRVPSDDIKKKIADFFNVSMDYLLGRTDIRNETINKLTQKDEKDIQKELDALMRKLESEEGLMFDGEPLDEETLKKLRVALEMGMTIAKIENKKYTPKKYRKDK